MATTTFKQYMEQIWGRKRVPRKEHDIEVDVITRDHKPIGVVYHGTKKPLSKKVILWSKSNDMSELAENLIGLNDEGIDIHSIEEPHTRSRKGNIYTLHIMNIINKSTKSSEGVGEDNSEPLNKPKMNVGSYPTGIKNFQPTGIRLPN